MNTHKIILVIHDVRSTHNVGSMLRTADAFGVNKVYLTGYTPYPETRNDKRLPHLRQKVTKQIQKTALGAELSVDWEHSAEIINLVNELKNDGYQLIALEQTPRSKNLTNFKVQQDIALIVGNEIDGISPDVLQVADIHLQIPMLGEKESLNVSVAAAVGLFQIKFHS